MEFLVIIYFIFITNIMSIRGKYSYCSECFINTTRPKNMPWKCGDCEDGIKR